MAEKRSYFENLFFNRIKQAPFCGIFYPHLVAVARLSRPHSDKNSYKLGLAVHKKPFSDTLWETFIRAFC